MKHYYYHGTGDSMYALWTMCQIIDSGKIKLRNFRREDKTDVLSHICLYKKTEGVDYSTILTSFDALFQSARSAWIDNCWGFIISPDIVTEKATLNTPGAVDPHGGLTSNIVDEYRCYSEITLDKIVGIFLPIHYIEEELDAGQARDINFRECYQKVIEFANSRNLIIQDSEQPNFTDILDATLSEQKHI